MDFNFYNAALLIHMASLLYVVAFLVRDQLVLRVLVLIATALYIGYYYFVPEVPLWDAIWWSVILGGANLLITIQILLERTTYNLSSEENRLYERLSTMTLGELRVPPFVEDRPLGLSGSGTNVGKRSGRPVVVCIGSG